MSTTEGQARQIIEQADALLRKIQKDIDESDAFFRDSGIDRNELARALAPYQGEEQDDEIARQAQADQEAIRREVEMAATHAGLLVPAKRSGRRPRPLV